MKRKYITAFVLFTIIIGALLTSCPASPPLAPTDGFNPYLAPKAPEMVEVSNGYADSITLSWDSVEDATSYMVWATPTSQYGTQTKDSTVTETYSKLLARGFELVEVVTEPSCKLTGLTPNTAYIFSIIAMKTMESKSTTSTVLYSEPSSFVEGSTAGDITLSAVANSKTITLFWDISNLYSVLSNSKEQQALYNYKLSIYKKLNSSNDWGEAMNPENNFIKEQYYSFGASSLEIDTAYDFKIHLEILDANGAVINTIESGTFTLTTDSSPIPESVETISANSGKVRNQVTLTWKAPALTERDDLTAAFRIERTESSDVSNSAGSSESVIWTEISADVIKNDDGTYSATDATLEDDTLYTYRIINGYQWKGKTPTFQESEDATTIQDVYALWVPQNITFSFSEAEDKRSATLTVNYTYEPPVEQGTVQYYVGGKTWTELDLSAQTDLTEKAGNTLDVSIDNEHPLRYYSFYFKFFLDGQEILNVQSPTDLTATLGTTGAIALIENLTATEDWVDAIKLSWKEKTALDSNLYTYEIYQDDLPITGYTISSDATDSTLKAVLLNTDTDSFHNYRVKVSGAGTFDVKETTGKTLAVPTGLSATDGTSTKAITITWPELEDDKLVYTLKYSYEGSTWTVLEATNAGQASLAALGNDKDGNKVSFKLVLTNKDQMGTSVAKTLESEVETGSVLGPALLNVRIENDGLDPDKITIKWNKVDGADYYKLKRNDVYLDWKRDADTYEDKVAMIKALGGESLNASYTYTVIPCLDDGTENGVEAIGATATGKLFAPPKDVKATKGAKGITLTWSSVENATSYQIQKYTVKIKNGIVVSDSKTKIGDPTTVSATAGATTQSYEETNESLLSEKILYEICSVKEDGTTSQWQTYYDTVKNSLGFEEAANIGYKLEKVSETGFVFNTAETTGYYEDYVVVTWHMVPGATSYTLTSRSGTEKTLVGSTTIKVSSLTYSAEDTVDNRISGSGRLSYNPEDELYTYYDAAGTIKDSYEINNYEIIANSETASSGTTDTNKEVGKGAKRQPNGIYWINPVLNILKPAFVDANNHYEKDWWVNLKVFGENEMEKPYTYSSSGISITFKLKNSTSFENANNYLYITSDKDKCTNLALVTTANIQLDVDTSDSDHLAGYLGTDPLKTIGYNGNGTISVTPVDTKLKPFTIQFTNINVNSASGGSYTVTIDGKSSETIEDNSTFVRVLGN